MERLHHNVRDKIHSRATGPSHRLTRQPVQGKKQKGGLRNGEMEVDVLVSYGAKNILRERLLLSSDAVDVCTRCFSPSQRCCCVAKQTVVIPYPLLLLRAELRAMGVGMSVACE